MNACYRRWPCYRPRYRSPIDRHERHNRLTSAYDPIVTAVTASADTGDLPMYDDIPSRTRNTYTPIRTYSLNGGNSGNSGNRHRDFAGQSTRCPVTATVDSRTAGGNSGNRRRPDHDENAAYPATLDRLMKKGS